MVRSEDNRWVFGAIVLGLSVPATLAVWTASRTWNAWLTALVIIGVVVVTWKRAEIGAQLHWHTTRQVIDIPSRSLSGAHESAALVRGMASAAGALHDAAGRAERVALPTAVDLDPAQFQWDG